jgi:hypothetical protein
MRKLVLIAAFVLTSVAAAEAGQSRSLVLAAHEAPVSAAETAPPQTTPAPQAQAAQAQTQSAQPQAAKPARKSYARRQESDEAKARRIAARYGVYW